MIDSVENHGMPNERDAAYAYRVPANPLEPNNNEWVTKVSPTPINAGDRLELSMTETVPSAHPGGPDEIVIHAAPGTWEVVEVRPGEDDGQPAGIRGWRGTANPIWSGTLVIRPLA